MTGEQLRAFARPRFRCIAADPPWEERGGGGRGAQEHYPLLSLDGIVRVMLRAWDDVGGPDPDGGCVLYLWTTTTYLPGALWVMDRVGFAYVTNWVWVKAERSLTHPTMWKPAHRHGLGQRGRVEHEHLLIGTRGSPPVPPPERRPRSVIPAPRARHSQKPPEAYVRIERATPGPRLEMFARAPREGWTVWGNEAHGAAAGAAP